jgi:hypothetical protein
MTDLLALLEDVCRSGDGWTARCPAHPDRHNSLSVHHRDGRWLLKCHAGCGWQESINALGIDVSALFDDEDRGRGDSKRETGEEITRNAKRRRIAPKPQFHRTILASIGRDEPDDGIPFN